MASYYLSINGKNYKVDADPEMPPLWAIRELANLRCRCGTYIRIRRAIKTAAEIMAKPA